MAYSLENTQDLTDLADAIRSKTGDSGEMTVAEMVDAVESISGGLTPRSVQMINDGYATVTASFLNSFPELLPSITEFILPTYFTTGRLFDGFNFPNITTLPPIIIPDGTSGWGINLDYMFENNQYLENITIKMAEGVNSWTMQGGLREMFGYCYRLKAIDVSFMQYTTGNSGGYLFGMFTACSRLRSITGLEYLQKSSFVSNQYLRCLYREMFRYCNCLDKVENIPVVDTNFTGNGFYWTFQDNYHLNKITFKTNNGVPQTANWNGHTLDLTSRIGYGQESARSLMNEVFGANKEVFSAATYNALKNDPDWWTIDPLYCRYNHDSAVETINSLPDVSAQSGCTIIFRGDSGTNTDGGPISALTAAEIAVATAKGWTITIQ